MAGTPTGSEAPVLPAAEQLQEIEAIKRLKARYFRLMDTKAWRDFEGLFTQDAELDVSDDAGASRGRVRGRREIAARIERAVGPARTVHHGYMPEIELTGATAARGVWAMSDYVEWPREQGRVGMRGYGHYTETYRKVNGQWQIASVVLTRLRVDPLGTPEDTPR